MWTAVCKSNQKNTYIDPPLTVFCTPAEIAAWQLHSCWVLFTRHHVGTFSETFVCLFLKRPQFSDSYVLFPWGKEGDWAWTLCPSDLFSGLQSLLLAWLHGSQRKRWCLRQVIVTYHIATARSPDAWQLEKAVYIEVAGRKTEKSRGPSPYSHLNAWVTWEFAHSSMKWPKWLSDINSFPLKFCHFPF